jgi:hypothetical protein
VPLAGNEFNIEESHLWGIPAGLRDGILYRVRCFGGNDKVADSTQRGVCCASRGTRGVRSFL